MRTIGIITTGVVAVVALFGVVLGLRSISDVRRYLKMRSM
jgi:hypothetical protein